MKGKDKKMFQRVCVVIALILTILVSVKIVKLAVSVNARLNELYALEELVRVDFQLRINDVQRQIHVLEQKAQIDSKLTALNHEFVLQNHELVSQCVEFIQCFADYLEPTTEKKVVDGEEK